MYTRKSAGDEGKDLCRILYVNRFFKAQIRPFLVWPISILSRPLLLNRKKACCIRSRQGHDRIVEINWIIYNNIQLVGPTCSNNLFSLT